MLPYLQFGGTTATLARRVRLVLRTNANRKLLIGAKTSYSGAEIASTIVQLEQALSMQSAKHRRIGILLPNSPEAAALILATLALEHIPVVLDVGMAKSKLESQLQRMHLDALVIQADLYPGILVPCLVLRPGASGFSREATEDFGNDLANLTVTHHLHKARPSTAVVLYTSGSSGEPKGVQLSASGIIYTVDTLKKYFKLDKQTVSTCVLPLCHTMGLNTQFLPTFFAGGVCVFHRSATNLRRIYSRILESQGTFVGLIAELLGYCLNEKHKFHLPAAESVQHVQLAGGLIRESHLAIARELFPNAVLHKGYGLTEAIRVAMISSRDPKFYEDNAGYVLPGQAVKILDQDFQELPPGSVGNVYVRGPNLMLGYDESVTEMPDVVNGFLSTGDLGEISTDGILQIYGRHDSIFKVKGKRVSGKEIERAAREALGIATQNILCLPIDCDKRGVRPVLFMEMSPVDTYQFLTERKGVFETELKDKLKDSMKTPKDIYLVPRFPRTTSGKIRSCRLRDYVRQEERRSDLGVDGQGFRFYLVPPKKRGLAIRTIS